MRLSQAWIIARHDLGIFRLKRGIVYGLIALPLGVGLGFPLLVQYILSQAGSSNVGSYLPGLIDAFSFWFVIGAGILPTAISSYAIVGEKIEKSLEPLLSTPTTDGELLLGKVLAAFVPTMLAIWAGSILFQGLIDVETRGPLGYLYFPNWEMAVTLFALTPLACLYAIEFAVIVSSRATDARSAQQYAGLVFFPLIIVYLAGEIGSITLDTTALLYISGILAVVVLALFAVSRRVFHREEILTRWK
ncbi:MAG: ABC transporter permease subunit [Thermoplasmata archaeon]